MSVGQSMPPRSGALRFTVPPRVASSQWFGPVLSRLRAAMGLPAGWDSYGGAPMTVSSVESAVLFLSSVLEPQSAPPTVVPLSDGGVQLVWHQNDLDVEVMLGTVEPELYVRDLATHQEFTLDPSSAEALQVIAPFVGRLRT